MHSMIPPIQQPDEKHLWFQELLNILERSEACLNESERLEEFDLVSICKDFTDQLEGVRIQKGKHDFWDAILQLDENAKDAIMNYYMYAEEESAKKVCENLVSAKEITL